ncbi:MAG: ABC transporter substrate-binding protein [Cyanobacteria bacterium SID2]|nr:ABC transporter substrate-binding protein [Cyanobacteria bacterium SID2]MBP0005947.1 ABC transporter substrate-binding protein [Cyanobacteria bacterium SBC]
MTKFFAKQIFFCCITSFLLTGCLTHSDRNLQTLDRSSIEDRQGCVSNYDPKTDYFPNKVSIDRAEGFSIEYKNNYKIVTVLNPWKDAEITFQYVLVQCGTPIPKRFDRSQIIEVPVRSVVALSTTYLPHLDKLNLVDRIAGVRDFKQINTQSVIEKIEAKQIAEVGRDRTIDIETILNLNPDIVMTFGTGRSNHDSHPKLREAGLNVALNAEYLENSPLGRAEWLKFTAVFFNRDAEAEAIFTEIEKEYNRIVELVRNVKNRPTVFTGFSYDGTWYVPGGKSYVARFLTDAGASYLWQENPSTGSIPLDFEVVYDKASEAEFWLNFSQSWQTKANAIEDDPRYGSFSAWQLDRMYNNTARVNQYGGNDYWESGIVNPHLVLTDLVKIFHPELMPESEMIYYQKLD